jgi:hypothetical protein
MAQADPTGKNREELVKELAENAVRVARGSAADARERYTGESKQASDRLESAVEREIDDLFAHPEMNGRFEFENLKSDVLEIAEEEVN